uniref:Uncharacterized protein n=1 Tax=Candidatus Kentrum sp. LFY TaxID=2126342 RepID=A0A450UFF5_9GAMM|nr:MAG: hypothetical protein BECKLFY1418A_GA0070994_101511 [Candidatus Kentron sp. LFY]
MPAGAIPALPSRIAHFLLRHLLRTPQYRYLPPILAGFSLNGTFGFVLSVLFWHEKSKRL